MARLSRRTVLLGGAAASVVGGLRLDRAAAQAVARQPQSPRPALPIPPELRANANGVIALDSRPGSMRFLPDKVTATYGINGALSRAGGARCGGARRSSCRSPTACPKPPPCIGTG